MVVKRKLIWMWEADYASYFIPRICILDINESLGNKSVNILVITNLVHDYHNYVLPYILLFSSHIMCIQLKMGVIMFLISNVHLSILTIANINVYQISASSQIMMKLNIFECQFTWGHYVLNKETDNQSREDAHSQKPKLLNCRYELSKP